ncbi:hypothetical protein [Streptomyces sp. SYSU K217416]
MSDRHHRRLGVVTGAALLLLAATGCSGLGRTAVGTMNAGEEEHAITISNPPVKGCQSLGARGATHVVNNTLVDLVLYRTPDCKRVTEDGGTYVATRLSDTTAPGTPPWRSYSFIH